MGQAYWKLQVWREAMTLVEDVYRLCNLFPTAERFTLSIQLKRAAISIPSNIAEGARRRRRRLLAFHLEVALGSQAELEVQLELAKRLGFVSDSDWSPVQERVDHVGRMLNRLIDSVRTDYDGRQTTDD